MKILYRVVRNSNIANFEEEVAQRLTEGWSLSGNLAVSVSSGDGGFNETTLYQEMTKGVAE